MTGKLHWTFKQEKIDAEKRLDGCYIVCARSVSKETMATNVRLSGVEFQTVGTPEADQEEILELLGVKLK